jgi:hypothetical protein
MALLDIYGLAISLVYPVGREGGIWLVQMKPTFHRGAKRKGRGKSYQPYPDRSFLLGAVFVAFEDF